MNVKEFKKITVGLEDYELCMSCMTLEYTKKVPSSCNCGETFISPYNVEFTIDWNGKWKSYVSEVYEATDDQDIISWDVNDGNMIEFEDIVIDHENKVVILV